MLKNRSLFFVVFICMAFGALTGCLKKKTAPMQVVQKPRVTVTNAVLDDYTERFNFPARVNAVDEVALKARVAGFLKERRFQEGDFVKKGETLFVIEREPFKARVAEASANLAKAEADAKNAKLNLDRALQLRKTGNISQATVDTREAENSVAKATVMQSRAALNLANLDLGYTKIKAPFSGKVGLSAFSVGEYLAANTTLASMVSYDPINVLFSVSERELLAMQAGGVFAGESENLVISLGMGDGSFYKYDGALNFKDVVVDDSTDTIKLRAVFPNASEKLISGQFVSIIFEYLAPKPEVQIPQAAMISSADSKYVFVVDNQNKVVNKPIVVGPLQGEDVVVFDGLKEGERVIVEGIQKVRAGIEVVPETAEKVTVVPPVEDASQPKASKNESEKLAQTAE